MDDFLVLTHTSVGLCLTNHLDEILVVFYNL